MPVTRVAAVPGLILTIAFMAGCSRSEAPGEQSKGQSQEALQSGQSAVAGEGQTAASASNTGTAPGTPSGSQSPGQSERGASGGRPTQGGAEAEVKKIPPPARKAVFQAGTTLAVRTTSKISTKTSKAGDKFVASLAEPLVEGNWVVAPKGSQVIGRIVSSDPGGRVKGKAMIQLQLVSLQLADGRTVDISTGDFAQQAKSSAKKDALKVGIGAGIGAAIGAIAGGGKGAAIGAGAGGGAGAGTVLLTRGDAAEIPSESLLRFDLTKEVVVVEKR